MWQPTIEATASRRDSILCQNPVPPYTVESGLFVMFLVRYPDFCKKKERKKKKKKKKREREREERNRELNSSTPSCRDNDALS